jgi:hypothetical protein
MGARRPIAVIAWLVLAPFLVGGVAFAFGGLGAGIFGLVSGALVVGLAVRFDKKIRIRLTGFCGGEASEPRVEQFRRWWMIALAAAAIAVGTAFLSCGAEGGAVAAACLVVVGVGGGVALAVMRVAVGKTPSRAPK